MNRRIAVIYGTRPEAIKLAPLVSELVTLTDVETRLICSGQHKEMLSGILELWNLRDDILLASDFGSSSSTLIPRLMTMIEPILLEVKPDLVIVQGDTATAAAAALQAHALHIPIAHIEAGLRSGDLWNPWPEESNRRIIDALSTLHFAPTAAASENLQREGHATSVYMTGNTIVDAVKHVEKILQSRPDVKFELERTLNTSLDEGYILFTQHRREGFGHGQDMVFDAINRLAKGGHRVIFPVHLNPSVTHKASDAFENNENIFMLAPQPYLPFLELIRHASLIISDSGGLQEEAPSFGKRIIVTRLTTEREEVISTGFGRLVGYDSQLIHDVALEWLAHPTANPVVNPFGDGFASSRAKDEIVKFLSSLGE